MSEYYISRVKPTDEDIEHYGVLGMKWGVRRAVKNYSNAPTSERRSKAVASLNKHRVKATNKIAQLEKKTGKLQKKRDKQIVKQDIKAAKLDKKSAKYEAKQYGFFTSKKKADKYAYKAGKYRAKARKLQTKSMATQSKIDKNKKLQETFRNGISTIDSTLAASGQKKVSKLLTA